MNIKIVQMGIKIVKMDIKIVQQKQFKMDLIVEIIIKIDQIDIKIEPINFVQDHFFIFQKISICHACGRSARPINELNLT